MHTRTKAKRLRKMQFYNHKWQSNKCRNGGKSHEQTMQAKIIKNEKGTFQVELLFSFKTHFFFAMATRTAPHQTAFEIVWIERKMTVAQKKNYNPGWIRSFNTVLCLKVFRLLHYCCFCVHDFLCFRCVVLKITRYWQMKTEHKKYENKSN